MKIKVKTRFKDCVIGLVWLYSFKVENIANVVKTNKVVENVKFVREINDLSFQSINKIQLINK